MLFSNIINVYNAAKHACNIFPIMYGFIEILFLDVILSTWSNTDKPPNPSKNAQITILIEMFLFGIEHTLLTPFVSSIIPEKILSQNSEGNPKKVKIGEKIVVKISKKWVLSSIELITENSTTKPPIITIVFIEFLLLLNYYHILILFTI